MTSPLGGNMVQKIYYAKTQMSNGLVSPVIEGRPDFVAFDKSCRQELNVISTIYGSAKGRGGTVFVGSTKKDTDRFILIPFIVGERVSYVLEFGDRYMRVYRYHDRVVLDNAIYEIETPYALKDFFDEDGRTYFDYKQSADVLYIVHEKYSPIKLLRYGDTNWVFSDVKFNNGPWQNMNTDKNLMIKAVGGNTGIVTLSAITGTNPVAGFSRVTCGSGGNVYAANIKFYVGGHDGTGTKLVERTWPHPVPNNSWAQLAAQIINSLPQFVATNPTIASLEVTAISNQSEYSNVPCSIYVGVVDNLGNLRSAFNNGKFSNNSTPINLFTQDWVGRKIRLTQIDTVVEGWRSGWSVAVNTICRAGSNYYLAKSAGATGPQMPNHIEGIENDGGVSWEYIHSGYGSVEVTEYVSETEIKAKVLDYIPSGVINSGTWQWEFSLLDRVTGTWPCAIEFFKDRLCFGVNLPSGPTIIFSVSGDYENFADLDHGEQLPESAITLNTFTELNKIMWLCTQDNLYIGTEGSILMVETISASEVFGPDNVTYKELASIGTCKVPPIKIGGDILFLGPKGSSIYKIEYNLSTDSYEPIELSVLAGKHLEFGITAWALQYIPNKMIYCLRSDGKVVGLVYNRQHEITAFNILETKGYVETVCVIPNSADAFDEVWFGVKRNINNETKRYIEYGVLDTPVRIPLEYTKSEQDTLDYILNASVMLDCAVITNSNTEVSEVSIPHLNGEEVSIVADGEYYKGTVENNIVSLPKGAKHIVIGLPYLMVLEPMPITQDFENGTGLARAQRINSIIARIYRTHSFKYGPSMDKLVDAKVNTDYTEVNGKASLKSGDIKLDWPGDTTNQVVTPSEIVDATGARMLFVQDKPFPVHWCAFSIALGLSEDIR